MDQILSRYKQKIENWIDVLKNNFVVFDFDGTLVEMAHDETRLLPCSNNDLNEYAQTHNVYAHVKPLEIMQYIVSQLDPSKVYVLTVSQPNIIEQKQRSVNRLYPNILNSHVLHVANAKAKYVALQQLHADVRNHILFIDDDLTVLLQAEEGLAFVKSIHISSFIQ